MLIACYMLSSHVVEIIMITFNQNIHNIQYKKKRVTCLSHETYPQ